MERRQPVATQLLQTGLQAGRQGQTAVVQQRIEAEEKQPQPAQPRADQCQVE